MTLLTAMLTICPLLNIEKPQSDKCCLNVAIGNMQLGSSLGQGNLRIAPFTLKSFSEIPRLQVLASIIETFHFSEIETLGHIISMDLFAATELIGYQSL